MTSHKFPKYSPGASHCLTLVCSVAVNCVHHRHSVLSPIALFTMKCNMSYSISVGNHRCVDGGEVEGKHFDTGGSS